ncbi:hypothetical protein JM654_03810 [Microbacterium oxydans]|nr:hypothetical protein [Microbacterium oxydans]
MADDVRAERLRARHPDDHEPIRKRRRPCDPRPVHAVVAEWSYPIDLPADGAGTISATWEYWKKLTIEDLLTQIEELGYESCSART